MADFIRADHGLNIRQACAAVNLRRSVCAYQPRSRDDGPIIEALTALTDKHPKYGFAKMFQMIQRQEHAWNHKRVYRVYCALKINLRCKGKKRLPSRNPQSLSMPDLANICWSVDFMSDVLYNGQRFRTFDFSCLSEVRKITDRWLRQYNEERPQESLGNLTPAEFLALNDLEVSTIAWQ